MAQPISNRAPPISVEYDGRDGKRVVKYFECCFEARRFFVSKDREGKSPTVRRIEMGRKNREVAEEAVEQEVQGDEPQVEGTQVEKVTNAQERIEFQCDALKEHLKATAMLYYELELVGQAKRVRTEYDKMDARKEKLVKRVGKSGNKEEREAAKATKREERIAKLRAQLAKLTEDDEEGDDA